MGKATLILLRHAKSDWYAGIDEDKARPLSTRGRKDAPRMGKWLAQQDLIPDIILCSSAVRTKQTIKAVNEYLNLTDDRIIYVDAIYAASLDDLLSVIEQYNSSYNNILITGHNPGMDELLCFLSETQPPLSSTGKLMTTAAVAVLNYPDTDLSIGPGSAKLSYLIRPKELKDPT